MKQYKEPQTRTHTQPIRCRCRRRETERKSNPQIICRYVTEFLFATNRTAATFWLVLMEFWTESNVAVVEVGRKVRMHGMG